MISQFDWRTGKRRMRSLRSAGGAPVSRVVGVMDRTKDAHVVFWLSSLLLLNLHCLPVTSQENMTETATEITTITSFLDTNYTSDAVMTSVGINTTTEATELQTKLVTEIGTEFQSATAGTMSEEALQTEKVTEMTTELENMTTSPEELQTERATEMTTEMDHMTTSLDELQTEWVTEVATEMDNMTILQEVDQSTESSENATETMTFFTEVFENLTERATESMPVTEESTSSSDNDSSSLPVNMTEAPSMGTVFGQTVILSTTDEIVYPTRSSPISARTFIIPILIFMGLLFLLTILIFIVVLTKSRMKRTVSTYNLAPAANGSTSQIGYRNTAYEQGDLADDTDVECSMRELRLEGKTTNGDTLQNHEGFEEELTPL